MTLLRAVWECSLLGVLFVSAPLGALVSLERPTFQSLQSLFHLELHLLRACSSRNL
jgi:hypothetical protein